MSENLWNLATALRGQILYAALVILWQVGGKGLELIGLPSPGPSPSLVIAGFAFLIAGTMVLTASRLPLVFGTLALLSGYAAGSTILNSFLADPSLWPSDFARYAGVAINVVGVSAAAYSLMTVVHHILNHPVSSD